jgi:hypothetical protein
MKPQYMLPASIVYYIGFETAGMYGINSLEGVAHSEQMFIRMQRQRRLNQGIEAFHVLWTQPHRQAQLGQRTTAACLA